MASEPSHKRKRVAIDHAAARRQRNNAQPLHRPSDGSGSAPANGSFPGSDGRSDRMRVSDRPAGAPRRTRIPYDEHGAPARQRSERGAPAQNARSSQGRQARRAVPFHDEPSHRGRERSSSPYEGGSGYRQGGRTSSRSYREPRASQDAMLQTPPMGGSASVLASNGGVPSWVKLVAAVVVIIALLWVIGKLFSCGSQRTADPAADEPAAAISTSPVLEERLASYAPYENPQPTDLNQLSRSDGITTFALSGQVGVNDPELSDESSAAIDAAMAPFVEGGYDVSFVLMDIGTGRGIACNVDEPIYGASSFKGPYSTFVAETYVDEGEVAFSEVKDDLFNIIVYSDNGTYDTMRGDYSDARLIEWLEAQDVDAEVGTDTWYPTYTARNLAKLWLTTHAYLEGDTRAASALAGYFGNTKTSFIRTAITDAQDEPQGTEDSESADGSDDAQVAITEATLGSSVSNVLIEVVDDVNADDIAVLDKAGWYPRDEDDIPAIVDAGIVECNGRDYLLCVMTDMPWTVPNQKTVEALIEAVFNTRNDLG